MRLPRSTFLIPLAAALGCGSSTGPCDTVIRSTVFGAQLTAVPPSTFVETEVGMVMEDYGKATARRPAAVRWYPTSTEAVSPATLRGAIDTVVTTSPDVVLGVQQAIVPLDSITASSLIEPLVAGFGRFYLIEVDGTVIASGPIQRVSGGDVTSACPD